MKKVEGGQTTFYLRSTVLGGQVVAEYNQTGAWTRGYVYDGNAQLLAVQQNNAVNWVHTDPVTKSKRVTNRQGEFVSAIDVDPWGGETSRMENGGALSQKYTTYERDGNGRDQAMMRSYHAWFSRFDQPDPYDGSYDLTNPQSFNRYAYVNNDPVSFVDPSGLESLDARHARLRREARERLNSMGREIDLGFGRRGPYRLEDPRGFLPQNPPQRNPSDIKRDFYKAYEKALNDCIKKVFGKDARKISRQTLKNAPVLDARRNQQQLGVMSGTTGASGSNDPNRGRYGTVYVASEVFNSNTPNTLNAINGTYVHELGNILDARLNPYAADYEATYGNPNDPVDTDTGAALERCLFGSLQYP